MPDQTLSEFFQGFGAHYAADLVNQFAGGLTVSATRNYQYAGNRVGATQIPTIDQLMRLWWTGRITEDTFADGLNNQGVLWTEGNTDTRRWPRSWWNIIDLGRPQWSPEQYRKAFRQGRLDESHYKDAMARHGFAPDDPSVTFGPENDANYRLFTNEAKTWSVNEAIDMWKKGVLTWDDLAYYLKVEGVGRVREQSQIAELWQPPTTDEAGRIRNRLLISGDEYDLWLKRAGFANDNVRAGIAALRYEVPGPSDLVRFAVRHVFEPDLIARFGFNDERNPILDFYHQTAGINYRIFTGPLSETIAKLYDEDDDVKQAAIDLARRLGIMPPRGGAQVPSWLAGIYQSFGLPEPTWAMAYWWSHWVWIAPTQAYGMLQRFRPGRVQIDTLQGKKDLVFTEQDLNLVLRGNDYPPYFRPFLQALSYNVIPSMQIRRLRQHTVIDFTEMTEMFKDAGYNPKDAERMATASEWQIFYTRAKGEMSGLRTKAMAAYKTGTMSRADAAGAIYLAGQTSGQELERIRNLSDTERAQEAATDSYVQLILNGIDVDIEQQIAKQSILAVRKAYLRLEIDEDGARQYLAQLGIALDRIDTYLRLWRFQFLGRGKTLTAAQILRYVVKGAILPAEAIARIILLGYTQADAFSMVGVAQQDYALAQARMALAAAKSQTQAINAAKAQLKEADRVRRQAMRDLAAHGTPKQIAEWFAAELISQEEVDLRFDELDWPMEDRQRLLAKAIGASKQRVFNEDERAAIEAGKLVPDL